MQLQLKYERYLFVFVLNIKLGYSEPPSSHAIDPIIALSSSTKSGQDQCKQFNKFKNCYYRNSNPQTQLATNVG